MGLEYWDLTKQYLFVYFHKLLPSKIDFMMLNFNTDVFLFIKNNQNLSFILNFFKFNSLFSFNFFCDFTAVDFFYSNIRYKLIYNLTSIFLGLKLFINLFINNSLNFVPSIHKIYQGSNWSEREVWDMFGIFFLNNFSLKRILTDYGFKGNPLKKDFPLIGYIEMYYNILIGEVMYKSVELSQEYRFYSVGSNWEA